MKKCPFCAEEIQDDAIKCRYCGEFLIDAPVRAVGKQKRSWLYSNSTVVIAILALGPFAMPLVWFHPRYKRATKIIVTVVVVVITIWAVFLTHNLITNLNEQMNSLGLY